MTAATGMLTPRYGISIASWISTSPQYNVRHHAMQGWQVTNIASLEKIDDYTIAAHTTIEDSLLPYEITGYFQVSNCAVTKDNNDYAALPTALRHRALQIRQGRAA